MGFFAQIDNFFAPKHYAMKKISGIDEKLPTLERSIKAGIKLRCELLTEKAMESIPLMELSFLAEDIHV